MNTNFIYNDVYALKITNKIVYSIPLSNLIDNALY